MLDPTQLSIAYTTNGLLAAYIILVNCLKNNEALEPTQLEDALRTRINAKDADSERLDYQILQNILSRLEGKSPPPLRFIPGGKTD